MAKPPAPGLGAGEYAAWVPAARLYNPPPTWPAPALGWQPTKDWEPDPAWGPAPAGWRLFERVNPHPFLRSWAMALALFGVVIAVFAATVGVSAYQAGGIFTRVALFPALATGLLLRTRRVRWSPWTTAGAVLLTAVAASILGVVGSGST